MLRNLLLVTLVLGACTGGSTTTTVTMAPEATSTTRPTLVDGGLVPADPATLIPYEESETVVVGRWHDGVVSDNGRWTALVSGQDGRETNQISIVDSQSGEVVATGDGTGDGLAIGDSGVAVWFEEGILVGLERESGVREWGELRTSPGLHDTLAVLGSDRVLFLSGSSEQLETTAVVEVAGGEVATIPIDVISGPAPSVEPGLPSIDWLAPGVAWTEERAFIVSATEDQVLVVDLDSGSNEVHEFDSGHLSEVGGDLARDVYASTDGSTLMIATRVLEVERDGSGWEARDYAADVVIIDTSDWSSQSVEQSVWRLVASPDGRHVVGVGASVTRDSQGNSERLDSPVYLFDGMTGQPLVGFEGRSGTVSHAGFSADGAFLYVTSHSDDGTNVDVVDVASQELVGSLGFTGISLIEETGLVAFHSQPR